MGKKKKQKMNPNKAVPLMQQILDEARSVFEKNKPLANKLAKKARRISLKNKVKMPSSLKRQVCKNCSALLVPGKNLRVRTRNGHVVYYCLDCKKYTRFVYK